MGVNVVTEAGLSRPESWIKSGGSQIQLTTRPAELMQGIRKVYEMLAQALGWVLRKSDGLVWLLAPSAAAERTADAQAYTALLEEIFTDSVVWLAVQAAERSADGAVGIASGIGERHVDAKAYTALGAVRALADALAAIASQEVSRQGDARVYFAEVVERRSAAAAHSFHISDIAFLQQFLAGFLPIVATQQWGAYPLFLEPQQTAHFSFPVGSDFNKAVVVFGKEIDLLVYTKRSGGAWQFDGRIQETQIGYQVLLLNNDVEEVGMRNIAARRNFAIAVWWK